MTTFAERLKNAMEQANMSQSALSEQAGASKAAISQYLSGKNTPGPDRIKALADATGVSFDYLMGYGAAPVAEPPTKKPSEPFRTWKNCIWMPSVQFRRKLKAGMPVLR